MGTHWKMQKPAVVITSIAMALSLVAAPGIALADESASQGAAVPEWAVDDGSGEVGAEAQADLPAKYDLRDEGVVTPVKLQSPWGTCWAFGGIAAAEISMGSATGTPYSESGLDLSERHLAWFAVHPVTDVDDPRQAGEGLYPISDEGNEAFQTGGQGIYITTLFAQGVGPHTEAMFPYRGVDENGKSRTVLEVFESDPEGETLRMLGEAWGTDLEGTKARLQETADKNGLTYEQVLADYVEKARDNRVTLNHYSELDDWTISPTNAEGQSNRTYTAFEVLKDGNVLPSYWNSERTALNDDCIEAMKRELVNGRGVSILYKADKSRPGQQAKSPFMNTDTYSQYTFDPIGLDHSVCIVGWDDDYAASNFTHTGAYRTDANGNPIKDADGNPIMLSDDESQRLTTPPGNGAWIVKNSWGSETDQQVDDLGNVTGMGNYGVRNAEGKATGYFYLSYYDKTIVHPETMTFSTSLLDDANSTRILQHDYMAAIGEFYTTEPSSDVTSSANVFDIDEDVKLRAVSTRTSEKNQRVTLAVYRLNDGAQNPTDGQLLARTSSNFELAGFHRVDLDQAIPMKAGERLSVVSTASTLDADGNRVYTVSANEGWSKQTAEALRAQGVGVTVYAEAVVNEGESFLYQGGKWVDWSEYIPQLPPAEGFGGYRIPGSSLVEQAPIDNFSIKVYATPDAGDDEGIALSGKGHVQDVGDVDGTNEGGVLSIGTTGQSRRLESFSMSLPEGTDGSISYRGHVQNLGWTDWTPGGELCGTTAQSLRVEALQLTLDGAVNETNDVWYRAHVQDYGWLGWAKDGEPAGTQGQGLRVESIEAVVLPVGQMPTDYDAARPAFVGTAAGRAHVQEAGWVAHDGTHLGDAGQGRRLEALQISACDLPWEGSLVTQVLPEGSDWADPAADGAVAGTTGESRRLEAVRLTLEGEAAEHATVWYRVHSQDYGWLGWTCGGADAGTTGLGKRIEAMEVQVLPTGTTPMDFVADDAACING